jgi:hypothetical protein
MFAASIDASQIGINLRALFQTARGRMEPPMKQERLAQLMGYSEQQLSRELDGNGPSMLRLVKAAKGGDPDGRRVVGEIVALLSVEAELDVECDPVATALSSALSAVGRVIEVLGKIQPRMERVEAVERVMQHRRRA